VASAHGRSTLGNENGRFWAGEAILRPFLHWQCQLGTVPYTVLYSTVQTVKYGHQNTLRRRILRKDGPYRPNRTVPSDRTCTTLVVMQKLIRARSCNDHPLCIWLTALLCQQVSIRPTFSIKMRETDTHFGR